MFGDVNISAILDSFSVSYDKRVRPNYGGTYTAHPRDPTHRHTSISISGYVASYGGSSQL